MKFHFVVCFFFPNQLLGYTEHLDMNTTLIVFNVYLPAEVNANNCSSPASISRCASFSFTQIHHHHVSHLWGRRIYHAFKGTSNLPQTSAEGQDLESGREC